MAVDLGAHRNLFWEELDPGWDRTWTMAVLCELAYVHQEPDILGPMGRFMGYSRGLNWVQTPGDITVNLIWAGDANGVVIVFSGTENKSQIAFYTINTFSVPVGGIYGRIHDGFYQIFRQAKPFIDEILDQFGTDVPIMFGGHSLGGAIAQIASLYYHTQTERKDIQCFTFGCPKIGSWELIFQFWTDDRFHPFRNVGDPVPTLPPALSIFGVPGLGPGIIDTVVYAYAPRRRQWVIDDELNVDWRGMEFLEDASIYVIPHPVTVLISAVTIAPALFDYAKHPMRLYQERVWSVGRRKREIDNVDARYAVLHAIDLLKTPEQDVTEFTVSRMNEILGLYGLGSPAASPPITPGGPTGPVRITVPTMQTIETPSTAPRTSVDLSVNITRNLGMIQQPGSQAVAYSTNRSLAGTNGGSAVSPSIFGGPQRPFWHFRGKDRLMIELLLALFDAIANRDGSLKSDSPESGRQTRPYIIDASSTAVSDAFQLLRSHMRFLLALTRNSS
jgi:hypothetical protein